MILEIIIIFFLMAVAIMLILLEIFFLPGITVAGIGGAIFAMGGLIYAYAAGTMIGNITLAASVAVFVAVFAWLMRSKSFSKIALNTDIDSKVTSSRELGIQPGDEGITVSRLAPIGKAKFNNITVEAKSTGEFIDENMPVVALRIDGYNIVVELKETE